MSSHSIVQAKNQLSGLIDRALAGENVVITRHGAPVVELKPIARIRRPLTQTDLEWLDKNRVKSKSSPLNAAELIRTMRDEEWN